MLSLKIVVVVVVVLSHNNGLKCDEKKRFELCIHAIDRERESKKVLWLGKCRYMTECMLLNCAL